MLAVSLSGHFGAVSHQYNGHYKNKKRLILVVLSLIRMCYDVY